MKISRRTVVDVGLLVLVNAMWAAQYPAYKVAGEALRPVTLSGWTFLMAALVLLPFLVRERLPGRRHAEADMLPNDPVRSAKPRLLEKRNIVGFLMIGILGLMPASAFLAWVSTGHRPPTQPSFI